MQKILYVEDDLSLIDGLQYTLEASGYMVDNAKTVKEALALFRKNTYDLLFWRTSRPAIWTVKIVRKSWLSCKPCRPSTSKPF